MKRILLTLIFTFIILSISAQDVDRDRRIMERVMADHNKYSFTSASHDTLEVAVKNAVARLASQIVTDVKVQAKSEIHSVTEGNEVEERLFFDQVAETFTNVRLKDYHTLVVTKPDRKQNSYTAFVYIEKESIDQIYAEIEAEEKEARQARAKKLSEDVNFYYNEGCKAVTDFRVGDALKYWYWSYALSIGSNVTIENEPAPRFLETKLEQLLNSIQVSAVSCEMLKINDLQEKFNVILNIQYKDENSILHKVTNLDYEYHDGYTQQKGARVRDGVGILELQYDLDEVRFYCVYNYDANETPSDVYALIKSKEAKKFASAIKIVKISNEAKSAKNVVVNQSKMDLPVTYDTKDEGVTLVAVPSESRQAMLHQRMDDIETAIRNNDYGSVKTLFTEEGYDSFLKLVRRGNATIVGKPKYEFMDFGRLTLCRCITMQFRFRNNKQFIENVTFRFNADNLVESLAFTLSDVAEGDILHKGEWNRDSRLTLMTFLEDYQTAYALGRDKYLESIFSDNALIIVGNKLESKVLDDGVRLMEHVRYDTLSKKQYIDRLRRHFTTKEYINLNFTETDFQRASNNKEMYGIRVRQEYFSSNYGDVGYLFLLVDLRGELPVIHVRAWQNDKLPIESLIELNDFY